MSIKPKRFIRPFSHYRIQTKKKIKHFFSTTLSNPLQNLSAISTIALGIASFILSIVVFLGKQEIADMDKLLRAVINQSHKTDSLIMAQHESLKKQDALLDSEHKLLIKQDKLIQKLTDISQANQDLNKGMHELNQKTLKQLISLENHTELLATNEQPNFIYSNIEARIGLMKFIAIDPAGPRTTNDFFYIEFDIENNSSRFVPKVKLEVYLYNKSYTEMRKYSDSFAIAGHQKIYYSNNYSLEREDSSNKWITSSEDKYLIIESSFTDKFLKGRFVQTDPYKLQTNVNDTSTQKLIVTPIHETNDNILPTFYQRGNKH